MPEKFKVWLQFIKVDENKAKYNIYAEDVEVKDCIFVFQVGFKNIWFQRNYRSRSGIEANVLKLAMENFFFQSFPALHPLHPPSLSKQLQCVESVSENISTNPTMASSISGRLSHKQLSSISFGSSRWILSGNTSRVSPKS